MPSLHRPSAPTNAVVRDYYKLLLRNVRLFRRFPPKFQKALLLLVIILLLLLIPLLLSVFNPQHPSAPSPRTTSRFQQDEFLPNVAALRDAAKLQSEATIAAKYVCRRRTLQDNLHILSLCGQFQNPPPPTKIVALVEVRNVEHTITPFLSSLAPIVDSVILLDDHSQDLTRNAIMLFNYRHEKSFPERRNPLVELLLNKSADWVREELFDRNALLQAGRLVGGTHFVLLDYDEYFSTNCVRNGRLRQRILELLPGESLNLPWVEMWKSPYLHAVLTSDLNMNLLTRRQVVIFADDKTSQYTKHNSAAKLISSSSERMRDTSIHVLRCPRTICQQPPHYHGHTTPLSWGNVQSLPECKIIEMRFLNLNNALLKAAWYEALGFIVGAGDNATTGKMVDIVLSTFNRSIAADGQIAPSTRRQLYKLVPTKHEWLDRFEERIFEAHSQVEMWRADDILTWMHQHGEEFFKRANVMPMLDISELKAAVGVSSETGDVGLYHVPRTKVNTLVIAFDAPSIPVLSEFLGEIGLPLVDASAVREGFAQRRDDGGNAVAIERWETLVEEEIVKVFRKGTHSRVSISCDVSDTAFGLSLLQMTHNDLSGLNVIAMFGDRVDGTKKSTLFEQAMQFSTEAGSHMRVIDVPLASFASSTSLHWLGQRVGVKKGEGERMVAFAEGVHRRYGGKGLALAPVAKLIFSLNVGRSGSKYLADVLRTAASPIKAVHEGGCPGKECTNGGGMRMQGVSLESSYAMRKRVKIPLVRQGVVEVVSGGGLVEKWLSTMRSCECAEIERGTAAEAEDMAGSWEAREIFEGGSEGCTEHVVKDGVYAETNPNFKAWFYDVVLDEMPSAGYEVTVMVVRKYIAAVLRSLLETGFFSTRDGYTWMETAAGVNSRVKAAALLDDEDLDAVDKLLSYVVNAEAVFREVAQRYGKAGTPGTAKVRFFNVTAEKMYGEEGTERVLRELGLSGSTRTWTVAGEVHDKYREGGKKRVGGMSLVECEERVGKLVARCGGQDGKVAQLLRAWARVDAFDYGHGHQIE